MLSDEVLNLAERADRLGPKEKIWLIEEILRGLRKPSPEEEAALAAEMAAMAADLDLQREVRQIQDDFRALEARDLVSPP